MSGTVGCRGRRAYCPHGESCLTIPMARQLPANLLWIPEADRSEQTTSRKLDAEGLQFNDATGDLSVTVILSSLPPWDAQSGLLNVVVDTPKGSRNKYKFDEELGIWRLGKVLPLGA